MAAHEISVGAVRASISDLGAKLVSLSTPDRNGVVADVVRRGSPYAGSVCGRFANRIANGRFSLGNVQYSLSRNDGSNHLHGGLVGFDLKQWTAEPYNSGGRMGVSLGLVSPDGEEGYPGTLTAKVTYWLDDNETLGIEFEATTTAPTIVNLTNHAYWNLGGDECPDIATHQLKLGASHYLDIDEELIPTGELKSVGQTRFDFTRTRLLNEPYDHCFALNDGAAAVLSEMNTGRQMRIVTNQPGIQVYTADHDGRFGVALETQGYPDAPNHANFPSAVLRPGETYRRMTRHIFSTC